MDIKDDWLLWFIKFLIQRLQAVVLNLCLQNVQVAEELHKPVIRKFKKIKVYSTFKDNIWRADLADMQLINKFNRGFTFLFCVIDIFSKYTWVVPLKDKKGVSIVKAFQSSLKDSNRKPNQIWIDKGMYCVLCIQHIARGNPLLLKDSLGP